MSTAPLSSPLPDAPAAPATTEPRWRPCLTSENLARLAIVALAAFLRLLWLDQRPPHFDEGVNGWFTDQMQKTGFYRYDPSNYHGPLHFYVLFVFKVLFGRNLWALRLPVALVGILTVDWVFRFRAFFGRRTCAWAALAMALSPGMTYFHRDAIHETWLVFFLVLAFWGICGLWQLGGKRHLWALGLGVTGAMLTKETYVLHFGCFAVAVAVLWLLEENLPSARFPLFADEPPPPPDQGGHTLWNPEAHEPRSLARLEAACAPQLYRPGDVWAVLGVSAALLVFFYSGNFYHWSGLPDMFRTFSFWGHTAHDTRNGHTKEFIYWTRLLLLNEPVAVAGLCACLRYVVPPLSTTRYRWFGVGVLLLCLGFVAAWFWPGNAFDGLHQVFDPAHHLPPGGPEPTDEQAERSERTAVRLEWGLGILTVVGLAGATSCLALPRPADWRLRLLAIYAPGTFLAYSLIDYKTPWCAVSFFWPFFFAAGAGLVELTDRYAATIRAAAVRAAAWTAAGVLLGLSAWWTVDLNYRRPTNEKYSALAGALELDLRGVEPSGGDHLAYAYVQTYNDLWRVTEPLLAVAASNPEHYHLKGVILCGSTYPLPWMLGDFTGIGYFGDDGSPGDPKGYRADFLLVEDRRVAEAEQRLDAAYFKETIHLRPAQAPLTLYLRATLFAPYFQEVQPARQPEFRPAPPDPAKDEPAPGLLPPGETLPSPAE